ncbi:clan AA aspartic protease [Sphingomonas lutea]|uniref:Clan AA aspartic protease n=1 Tax=Sphingomonas lutea TaxID=1045317 RepID=A0A7G9SET7_9SPHN|nr:clan AA aspartic protease [Sphingomonas lutea]
MTALASLAMSWGALAANPLPPTTLEAVSEPGEIDSTTQTQDIRFESDRANRMTVPVRLGQGTYRFLVDTGADRTAISHQLAKDLNLQAGPMATLHSVTGITSVATATVPALGLSQREVRIVDAPCWTSRIWGGRHPGCGFVAVAAHSVRFRCANHVHRPLRPTRFRARARKHCRPCQPPKWPSGHDQCPRRWPPDQRRARHRFGDHHRQ